MKREETGLCFRTFFDAHRREVAFALGSHGVTSADRPDLIQDVFLSVHRSIERGNHPSHDASPPVWRAWLWQFARRHAANYRRRVRAPETELLEGTSRAAAPDPERAAALRELLARLLDKLDARSRELVLAANAEDLSWQEIAEARGISVDRARYSLFKAVNRMTSAMACWEKREREPAVAPASITDLLSAALPSSAVLEEMAERDLESIEPPWEADAWALLAGRAKRGDRASGARRGSVRPEALTNLDEFDVIILLIHAVRQRMWHGRRR